MKTPRIFRFPSKTSFICVHSVDNSLKVPLLVNVLVINCLYLIQMLAENWQIIRDEGVAQLDASGGFRAEDENLREHGDWKQLTLYQQGKAVLAMQ